MFTPSTKRLLSLTTALLVASAMAAPAQAVTTRDSHMTRTNGNWYLGLSGDLTWLRNPDSKTGGGGNVALGYRFMPSAMGDFRVEAEGGYHMASGKGSSADAHYFNWMGNAYYDFNNLFSYSGSGTHISPYIGGGIGMVDEHYGNTNFTSTFHHHTTAFAYDGMAGLSLVADSMPNTDWSLGYKYLGANRSQGLKLHSHNIELGVRFNF